MPLILNGSTGISGNDGSASVPTIQGTDGNTGMFFPAADQIAFAEGGVEAMRLDASGNVGIGTSSPATRLDVRGVVQATDGTSGVQLGDGGFLEITRTAGDPYIDFKTSGAEDYDTRIQQISNGLSFQTGGNGSAVERARITPTGDFQFNSGYGSVATAYGCRAWVNFNGTGTVAIRASGNVSSITDNNVGDYTVNFTNAMPDANYAVVGSAQETVAVGAVNRFLSIDTTATTGARVLISFNQTLFDPEGVHVVVSR